MQPVTRRLVVVRHARAEPTAPSDHERPLTPEGRADAEEAGRWLAGALAGSAAETAPLALVSSALRAGETWSALARGAGWPEDARPRSALYEAGPDSVLDLVRGVDDDVPVVVVVGHNPTTGYLAQVLDGGDGDPDAGSAAARSGFPTCAVAVLALDAAWAEVTDGSGRLEAFHVGRA